MRAPGLWTRDFDGRDRGPLERGCPGTNEAPEGAETVNTSQLDPTTLLVVDDIEAARDELVGRGAEVGEIWHIEPGQGRVPGPDPQRRAYFSRASFAEPDGNKGVLEELTQRLPGRAEMRESGALAQLLFETARRHGAFEAAPTPHDWWDWYAAYMDARAQGSIQEEAAEAAGRYMAEVKNVFAVAA
jgi:hypothetical protein